MKKKITLLLSIIMLLQFVSVSAATIEDNRTILYVAVDGNDSADGSINNPFATIKRARDEIRELKKNGEIGPKGAVVYIRGGLYQQFETIELSEEDGGNDGAPIVYRGYPGEEVKIIGGINIPTNKIKKTEDAQVLAKVIEPSAKNNIYEVDLFDVGFKDVPKIFYAEVYGLTTAKMYERDPENVAVELLKKKNMDITTSAFEILIDNDVYSNARYPDEDKGRLIIERGIKSSYISGEGRYSELIKTYLNDTVTEKPVFLPSDSARIKQWKDRDLDQVYIWFKPGYGWAEEGNMVESIDEDGKVTCALPTFYSTWEEGNPCYFYNFFDEISKKEYYIDKDSAKLYLCLDKKPEQISDITVTTMDKPMFLLKNTNNIEISNIHFSKTKSYSVLIQGSKNCVVDNCEVSYTSIAGMDIKIEDTEENISNNCGVTNSYFHDVNGGVYIWSGDKATLTRGNNYIINNTFENFSRLKTTYNPAFVLEGVGNRAAYNKVYGSEHMAGSWGGNYQVIEFNEIYDVCTNTDDAAAFYAGQSIEPRGNTIRYNYFHDVGRSGQAGGQRNGSHAIYLDDGYSSAYVVGNVCYNVSNYGVFVGGGRDNVVFNNMMIDCGSFIFCDDRFVTGWNEVRIEPLINNGYWKSDIWKEAFPELYNMDLEKASIPAGNIFEGNLSYNSGAVNVCALATENGTVKNNYVTASDPGFVDMENKNFTLKEDAEIFEKIPGFMPIPFTRMGRCNERAMERSIPATIMVIDSNKAMVFGKEKNIDEDLTVKPRIYDNLTYVPLRFLAETIGYNVEFDDTTKLAELTNDVNKMTVNIVTGEITVNGEAKEAVKPIVVSGRTLLPLRAVSEMLSKKVFWDDRGFISISDIEDLFDSDTDDEIIEYLYSELKVY